MSAHSLEPWIIAKSGVSIDAGRTRIRQEASLDRDELKANAARIVACVNALAGISTTDLERACALTSYTRLILVSYLADRAAAPLEDATFEHATIDELLSAGGGR